MWTVLHRRWLISLIGTSTINNRSKTPQKKLCNIFLWSESSCSQNNLVEPQRGTEDGTKGLDQNCWTELFLTVWVYWTELLLKPVLVLISETGTVRVLRGAAGCTAEGFWFWSRLVLIRPGSDPSWFWSGLVLIPAGSLRVLLLPPTTQEPIRQVNWWL